MTATKPLISIHGYNTVRSFRQDCEFSTTTMMLEKALSRMPSSTYVVISSVVGGAALALGCAPQRWELCYPPMFPSSDASATASGRWARSCLSVHSLVEVFPLNPYCQCQHLVYATTSSFWLTK